MNKNNLVNKTAVVLYQATYAVLKIWLVIACCFRDVVTALLLLVMLSVTYYELGGYVREVYKEDDKHE